MARPCNHKRYQVDQNPPAMVERLTAMKPFFALIGSLLLVEEMLQKAEDTACCLREAERTVHSLVMFAIQAGAMTAGSYHPRWLLIRSLYAGPNTPKAHSSPIGQQPCRALVISCSGQSGVSAQLECFAGLSAHTSANGALHVSASLTALLRTLSKHGCLELACQRMASLPCLLTCSQALFET